MTGRRRSHGHGHGNNHAVVVLPSAAPAGVFFCAECGEVLTTRDHFRHHQETVHGAGNLAESESDLEDDEPEAEAAAEVPAAPASACSKRQRPRRGEGSGTPAAAGNCAAPMATGGAPSSKGHSKARSNNTAHDATSVVADVTSAAAAAGLRVTDAVTAAKHAVQELWVPKRKPTPGANGAKITLLRRPAAVGGADSALSDASSAAVSLGETAVGNLSPGSASAEAVQEATKSPSNNSSRTAERSRHRKPRGRKHTPECSVVAAPSDINAVEAAAVKASTTMCADPIVRTPAPAALAPTAAAPGNSGERGVSSSAKQEAAAMATRSAPVAVAEDQPQLLVRQQRNRGRSMPQQTGDSTTAAPATAAAATHTAVPDVAGTIKAVNGGPIAACDSTGIDKAVANASHSNQTGLGGRGRGRGRGPGIPVTAPVKVMWRPKPAGTEAQSAASSHTAATVETGGSSPTAPATNGLAGCGTSIAPAKSPAPPTPACTLTPAGGSRRYSRKQTHGSVGPTTAVDSTVNDPAGRPSGVTSLAAGMTGLAIA